MNVSKHNQVRADRWKPADFRLRSERHPSAAWLAATTVVSAVGIFAIFTIVYASLVLISYAVGAK